MFIIVVTLLNMIYVVPSKIPPAPFSRPDSFVGANLVFALLWSEHKVRGKGRIQDSPLQNCINTGFSQNCPPLNLNLKRGLGGFSELLFEVGKLFNHESLSLCSISHSVLLSCTVWG